MTEASNPEHIEEWYFYRNPEQIELGKSEPIITENDNGTASDDEDDFVEISFDYEPKGDVVLTKWCLEEGKTQEINIVLNSAEHFNEFDACPVPTIYKIELIKDGQVINFQESGIDHKEFDFVYNINSLTKQAAGGDPAKMEVKIYWDGRGDDITRIPANGYQISVKTYDDSVHNITQFGGDGAFGNDTTKVDDQCTYKTVNGDAVDADGVAISATNANGAALEDGDPVSGSGDPVYIYGGGN